MKGEVIKLRVSEQGTLELEGKVWGGNDANTIRMYEIVNNNNNFFKELVIPGDMEPKP